MKNMEEQINNEETTRHRFKRLATLRTNAVLKRLKVLGNCSNRSAYEYTKEDIEKIFSEIEGYTREVKAKFRYPKQRREFKL